MLICLGNLEARDRRTIISEKSHLHRHLEMLNNNLKAKSHSHSAVYPWDHFNAMGNEGVVYSMGYFMVALR